MQILALYELGIEGKNGLIIYKIDKKA